jgi:hypothetical protein
MRVLVADGSEGAEDQQLLDGIMTGKFEVNYGTYYDHNNGYYYDYPMMLVTPEMSEHMGSNIMTAIPCAPVPLRPIEWVNSVFVPKLASQQYCYIDHQVSEMPSLALSLKCLYYLRARAPRFTLADGTRGKTMSFIKLECSVT